MLKTVSVAGIEEQGIPFKKDSITLEDAVEYWQRVVHSPG